MRATRLLFLLTLLLSLAACSSGERSTETHAPTPTSTTVIEPTPTPEQTPTPVPTPTPEPTPTPTPEPEEPAVDLDAEVQRVLANVVELRGLEPLDEINIEFITREELAPIIGLYLDREQMNVDLYWMLRLYDDRRLALYHELIDYQLAVALGFYHLENQTVYIVRDDIEAELSALEEVALAHEIVHALQDQYYGLLPIEDQSNFDRALAFRSVIDGDASLVQEIYALRYLTPERQRAYIRDSLLYLMQEEHFAAEEQIPEFLLYQAVFPYAFGGLLMLEVVGDDIESLESIDDEVWKTIDRVLEDPPVSMMQVILADEYLAGESPDPAEVSLPDLGSRIPDGWDLTRSGELGVLHIIALLEINGVDYNVSGLGDTLELGYAKYRSGDDLLTVMGAVLESEEAASQFERLLISTFDDHIERDGYWFLGGRYHTIVIHGNQVNLKTATDLDILRAAADLN